MPLAVGDRLGRYAILARLGAGGMGEVYRAHDTTLNRDVAIKILQPGREGDDRSAKRLLREAQSAAALDHPNICTVYEVSHADGYDFIAMQFVDGQTLADRLAAAPLSPADALAIAAQIADALAEAHRHRIVHRDIKPANIMLTAGGRVKVLDFGLAKSARPLAGDSTRSMMTAPGAIAGTVPYMSPEQIRGEDLDECSDIFSFGILLHQALTGEHPFIGPSVADTVSAILTRDPPRHSRIGARHADPRRQQRHIVLRPARSPSPFRTSSV